MILRQCVSPYLTETGTAVTPAAKHVKSAIADNISDLQNIAQQLSPFIFWDNCSENIITSSYVKMALFSHIF